jgi:zinc/manganese transport system substrate-binding protein
LLSEGFFVSFVRSVRPTGVAALAAGVLILGTVACTDGGSADADAAVASGNADACPGEILDVVVSVGQWGDVTRRLAGDCATVTTVVASDAVDPHDFEPGTADLAAFSDADLVVINGADYDHWAEDAVATLDPEPVVVSAADVAGAEEGADPHLWYEPEAVHAMAPAIAEELARLSPDAADYFAERKSAWQERDLRRYLDAVLALRSVVTGRTYAATETVFDRMAATIGLTDATPEGYRRSVGNESEPAPGDLAAFEAALADGSVDVLIHNTQTTGSVPEQLIAAAEDAGVPVVEVTESAPDGDGSFVAWQLDQLSRLSDALKPR